MPKFRNMRLFSTGLLLLIFCVMTPSMAQEKSEARFKTVVLDAGHGGRDPGAVGAEAKEKDVVLAVTLKVGEYLKRELPDLNVVYTRTSDVFVPLDERAEIANRAKADLFVSIHANAISNPRINGAETFVLGLHRSEENLEVAKKENSVIILEEDYTTKYEGFDPNSTESYIIFELMQNVYLDQSISAASIIQDQFEQRVGRRNRGVKQAGFLVLRKTSMPGVLVELGFMSNRNEERFMVSEEGQVYLASAVFRAIRDYKERFEARNHLQLAEVPEVPPLTTAESAVKEEVQANSEVVAPAAPQHGRDIEFRIQIASARREIEKGKGPYTLFPQIDVYREGEWFKYTTGRAASYEEISVLLEEVRAKVPDSFIIAFENGERVPVSSVR